MANEDQQASLSKAIGTMAASEPNQATRRSLVATQANNPNPVDAEAAFNRYKNQRALQGYKRGGKVKHTGLAKVHKGERVLTKKQQNRLKVDKKVGK